MNNDDDKLKILFICFVIIILIGLIIVSVTPSDSEIYYQEHKESIDTYYRNHPDRYNPHK